MSEYVKVGGQEWNERDGSEMLIDDVVLLDEENDGGTASSHSLHLSAYHSSPPHSLPAMPPQAVYPYSPSSSSYRELSIEVGTDQAKVARILSSMQSRAY